MAQFRLTTFVVIVALALTSLIFAKDPEVLFDVTVDKPVNFVYLIGENEDLILATNRARMFVYNANTGKFLWDTKVEGYIDEGLQLIWNDQKCIVSLKKGIRCYDIPTGKIDWETQTPLNMKDFSNYFNFKSGFVLNFKGILKGFNTNTGEVKWTSDRLDFNGKLFENNIANVYAGISNGAGAWSCLVIKSLSLWMPTTER